MNLKNGVSIVSNVFSRSCLLSAHFTSKVLHRLKVRNTIGYSIQWGPKKAGVAIPTPNEIDWNQNQEEKA